MLAVGTTCLLVAGGCASGPRKSGRPKSPVPPVPPPPVVQVPPPAPAPPPPARQGSEREGEDSTVIVIDDGKERNTEQRSLVEASRAERERRLEADPPTVVITNDNLSKFAKGQVTTSKAAPIKPTNPNEAGKEARDEAYWRKGALEIRVRWRRAVDEISELEKQTAGLRTRFYAEDDPYVRDTQVKPAWDRALERLRQARLDAEGYRQELETFLDEGRRAGALPGWLREGIEHEPEMPPPGSEEEKEPEGGLERHEPTEPPMAGKDGR